MYVLEREPPSVQWQRALGLSVVLHGSSCMGRVATFVGNRRDLTWRSYGKLEEQKGEGKKAQCVLAKCKQLLHFGRTTTTRGPTAWTTMPRKSKQQRGCRGRFLPKNKRQKQAPGDMGRKGVLRALFTQDGVPRQTWLAVRSNLYGKFSLNHYFPTRSPDELVEMMGLIGRHGRAVSFTHPDSNLCERIYYADRAQCWRGASANEIWISVGTQAPAVGVKDQLKFLDNNTNAEQSQSGRNDCGTEERPPTADVQPIDAENSDSPPAADNSKDKASDRNYQDRVGGETQAEQTGAALWCEGQTDALVQYILKLPRGSKVKVEHKPEGTGEQLSLHITPPKNHRPAEYSVRVDSQERAGRQMHCNKRYTVATVASAGAGITVAQRFCHNIGLKATPHPRNVLRQRQWVVDLIEKLGTASMERARQLVAAQAMEAKQFVQIGDDIVASVTAHSDGNGAKRSYANYAGSGVAAAFMVGTHVVCAKFMQNTDYKYAYHLKKGKQVDPGYRNHNGSVAQKPHGFGNTRGNQQEKNI